MGKEVNVTKRLKDYSVLKRIEERRVERRGKAEFLLVIKQFR